MTQKHNSPNQSSAKSEPAFEDGIVWAVARIVEMHDEPKMAMEIAREAGFTFSTIRRMADEADLPFINELAKENWDQ